MKIQIKRLGWLSVCLLALQPLPGQTGAGAPEGGGDTAQVMSVFRQMKATYRHWEGMEHYRNGRYDEALRSLDEVVEATGRPAEALFNRGVIRWRMGHTAEALRDVEAAIAEEPAPKFLYAHSVMLYRSGDTLSALEELKRYVDLDSADGEGWLFLGAIYLQTGQLQTAAMAFDLADRYDASAVTARNGQALVHLAMGDTLRAVNSLESSLQADPDQKQAWGMLGYLLHSLGQRDDARIAYGHVTELDPEDAVAWNALAVISYGKGEMDTAIRYCERAFDADGRYATPRNTHGAVMYQSGDFQKAESGYTAAIALDPGFAEAYYNRALCREMLRNENGACEDLKKAGSLGLAKALHYHQKVCE